MRIAQQTEHEVDTFDDIITLPSGVVYDHRGTLKHINNNKRGKFNNEKDTKGLIFWPLGMERAPHRAKKIDLDTRHFKVEGYGDFNSYQAWATNVRFRKWCRDYGFSLTLDDIGDEANDFGSAAIKLTEQEGGRYKIRTCDLMKLWFDPTIESFYGQTKIELHELEEHVVKSKKGWKHINKSWEKAETVNYEESNKADVTEVVAEKRKYWERVGYFNVAHYENEDLVNGAYVDVIKEETIKDEGGKDITTYTRVKENVWKFMHTIHCSSGDDEVVVFAEEIKLDDDVYLDVHTGKYEDRWMRIGLYEALFGLQRVVNEAVNYDREAQQIASLLLFRAKTNKRLVGSNMLQNAKSGDITDADLEQMNITNTFLNDFVVKLQAYERKADMIAMIPEVLSGQEQGKTFRGLAAQINQANNAFWKMRNRISTVISKMLVDRVLPVEVKDWNKEKSLEVSGFEVDIQMYDAINVIFNLNKWLSEQFDKGKNPTEEEKAKFVDKLRETTAREGRQLKFQKGFFNFDFGLAINAIGESENKEEMNDAYFNVISWILNSQGAVNYIPAFREYVEKNGITPFHLSMEAVQQLQASPQQGNNAQAVGGGKRDRLSSAVKSEE